MPLVLLLLTALLAAVGGGCDKLPEAARGDVVDPTEPGLDAVGLDIVVAEGVGPGLFAASQDLATAYAVIKGVDPSHVRQVPSLDQVGSAQFVAVRVSATAPEALGDQGYRLGGATTPSGAVGVEVVARTEVGAMYGLYDLAQRLGARYLHPERTFYPSNPALTLPRFASPVPSVPAFARRGFHEHTQHPIVMEEVFLAADPTLRGYASNYLRWLARNRQNVASFMLLKTIDLARWVPWMQDLVGEAHQYGIRIGAVASFADQQQNGYKLIANASAEPLQQIRDQVDLLLSTGFDFLTLQIGTSEFTKPDDGEALGWLETAADHVAKQHPGVDLAAWIHVPCDLEAQVGGLFYHLPLRASATVGAWVHTTMFYDLRDPAPVYGCTDFTHQQGFLRAASGHRTLTFFPETAWWLGFDNNLPLALPITGWSRQVDIQQVLPDYRVDGHVTFTSGREWGYWQYDHYLTQVTWDRDLSWQGYLDWMSPAFGAEGAAAMALLGRWTEQQVDDLYVRNPDLIFYLAGELAQDEIGEKAGILARRPKPSYASIYGLDDDAFEAWEQNDLELLRAMAPTYEALWTELAATSDGDALQQELYGELRATLWLFVQRLRHVVALYEAVAELRSWRRELALAATEQREPRAAIREQVRGRARSLLEQAMAITREVEETVRSAEATYRYPLSLLIEPRPNLTSYPFGYLYETHTVHFWRRRDEQLDRFIDRVFDESDDAWSEEPALLFVTHGGRTTMVVPDDPIAGSVIAGFVPQLLFGVDEDVLSGSLRLVVAEDANENLLPDVGREWRVDGDWAGDHWLGSASELALEVYDASGASLGLLTVVAPEFDLTVVRDGVRVSDVPRAELSGTIASEQPLALILTVGGIDEEGATNLVKAVYDLPVDGSLPPELPLHFRFRLTSAAP